MASVLSICTVMLQYEYEEYILEDICNGNQSPFKPMAGIDPALCARNYSHSHKVDPHSHSLSLSTSLTITHSLSHYHTLPLSLSF